MSIAYPIAGAIWVAIIALGVFSFLCWEENGWRGVVALWTGLLGLAALYSGIVLIVAHALDHG